MILMNKNEKIYITGHFGLVVSALVRCLRKRGYLNIVAKTAEELDLFDEMAVADFFRAEKPDYVFMAASKSGSIQANINYPAEFIYENLVIQNNIIHNAYLNKVKKLLFFGASCVYPKTSPQPIKEEYLLTGELESSSEAYAVAKIAGIKMCQAYNKQYGTKFISVVPATPYGPNDYFDPENSHVLSALLRKFYEAKINKQKEVILWGTGTPRREFIYIDDLAEAGIFIMNNDCDFDLINIGTGTDLMIKELAEMVKEIVDFKGEIKWDTAKPDGAKQKLLDVSRLHSLGWRHRVELKEGIKMTYQWLKENYDKLS
jgi:GDP-L-fucose synthase